MTPLPPFYDLEVSKVRIHLRPNVAREDFEKDLDATVWAYWMEQKFDEFGPSLEELRTMILMAGALSAEQAQRIDDAFAEELVDPDSGEDEGSFFVFRPHWLDGLVDALRNTESLANALLLGYPEPSRGPNPKFEFSKFVGKLAAIYEEYTGKKATTNTVEKINFDDEISDKTISGPTDFQKFASEVYLGVTKSTDTFDVDNRLHREMGRRRKRGFPK